MQTFQELNFTHNFITILLCAQPTHNKHYITKILSSFQVSFIEIRIFIALKYSIIFYSFFIKLPT